MTNKNLEINEKTFDFVAFITVGENDVEVKYKNNAGAILYFLENAFHEKTKPPMC